MLHQPAPRRVNAMLPGLVNRGHGEFAPFAPQQQQPQQRSHSSSRRAHAGVLERPGSTDVADMLEVASRRTPPLQAPLPVHVHDMVRTHTPPSILAMLGQAGGELAAPDGPPRGGCGCLSGKLDAVGQPVVDGRIALDATTWPHPVGVGVASRILPSPAPGSSGASLSGGSVSGGGKAGQAGRVSPPAVPPVASMPIAAGLCAPSTDVHAEDAQLGSVEPGPAGGVGACGGGNAMEASAPAASSADEQVSSSSNPLGS